MFSSSVTLSLVKLTVNASQSESRITILENPQVSKRIQEKTGKSSLEYAGSWYFESMPFQIWT